MYAKIPKFLELNFYRKCKSETKKRMSQSFKVALPRIKCRLNPTPEFIKNNRAMRILKLNEIHMVAGQAVCS